MRKPGDRVGVMIGQENGVIEFLGYGVYIGDELLPEEVGGFNFGLKNPKIQLDNGDIVWGCETWWGPEEKVKEVISRALEVKNVRIADYRSK